MQIASLSAEHPFPAAQQFLFFNQFLQTFSVSRISACKASRRLLSPIQREGTPARQRS